MTVSSETAYNLIGGKRWIGAATSAQVHNPADIRSVVGTVEVGSDAIVDAAVMAANRAWRDWAATPVSDRLLALGEAGRRVDALLTNRDLATLLTREQGKIRGESIADVHSPNRIVEATLPSVEEALRDTIYEDYMGRHITVHVPMGVAAVISPGNWPIILSLLSVIPALAAGNTVILKPAPTTPLAITEIVATMASALPPGVLNLVHGGADIGSCLVAHGLVRSVTFVGSVPSGRKIMQAAPLKQVSLELGGNDPAILLDDLALTDDVIQSLVSRTFVTAGQVCFAIKRIFVHDTLYERFVSSFADAVNATVVGDGLSPEVTMGPLHTEAQLRKVRGYMEQAVAAGAKVTTLGARAKGVDWDGGHFMLPSIVTSVPETCDLMREEQFGPVVPVQKFSDVDDVIARVNGSEYGLCSSIWTADLDRGFALARRVEAGVTWVNHHSDGNGIDIKFAYGGIKDSGTGMTGGVEGIRKYCYRRSLSDRDRRREPSPQSRVETGAPDATKHRSR